MASSLAKVQTSNQSAYSVIDEAWDLFSEHIGKFKLQTPITVEQFEAILREVDKTGRLQNAKREILHSLRYDSYSWPIVKR